MSPNLALTFNAAQLALVVLVLAFALAATLRFGFTRLIKSMDEQFEALRSDIDSIRQFHPTREEVDGKFSGVNRRIDDLRWMRNHGATTHQDHGGD